MAALGARLAIEAAADESAQREAAENAEVTLRGAWPGLQHWTDLPRGGRTPANRG